MSRRFWAADEIELVECCYEFYPNAELAELLDATVLQVTRLGTRLGLKKSRDVIAEVSRQKMMDPNHGARRHRFPKGNVPVNKGVKMPKGWAPGRMRETQFKKGQRGINTMPVGATRRIDGYLYRKISDTPNVPYTVTWKPVHHLLWQKHRGAIPRGHALVFKDGNVDNIKLRNLELITRGELMLRNTIHNLPKPLVQVIMLNGALKRKIRRRQRDAEEQNDRSARPPVLNTRRAA